jgi:CcmD family protein
MQANTAGGAGSSTEQPVPSPSAATSATTPDDRATTFRAVQGGGETVSGGKLLVSAYAVVWLIVLVLVVRVFRRQNKTESTLADLETQIRKGKKST